MRSAARRFLGLVVVHSICGGTIIAAVVGTACSSKSSSSASNTGDASSSATIDAGPIVPVTGASPQYVDAFNQGFAAFNQEFGEKDGLGPLYTEVACGKCHLSAGRGPGTVSKMAAVEADGLTPVDNQALFLAYGDTVHPHVVTDIPGAHTPILPPDSIDGGGADGGATQLHETKRFGPPLFGRGLIEAVEDSEIEAVAATEAISNDGIVGRINWVTFASQPNPDTTFDTHKPGDMVIGRFGLKARIATIDDFTADALQNDIGITSPLRPTEFKNPDNITDDLKPGIDVTADQVNSAAMFVRLLAPPPKVPTNTSDAGKEQFWACRCLGCHHPTMHTRPDYPIAELADIDAPIYTDMLLHDMGDALEDSIAGGNEGGAKASEWRTAPLIGVRYSAPYLHDGRAATIEEAILDHDGNGSQAAVSVSTYKALSDEAKQNLLDFVNSL
jgi:CxxC motif-containing protein (DUF1111 family)